MTKIDYFISPTGKNPVKEFLWQTITKQQRAKVFRFFLTIEEYGLGTHIPHLRKLTGTPLWEMKLDAMRIIYATKIGNDILLLHGFVKKKQKTPLKDLQTALSRYSEWRLVQKAS